ncbi:MAG: hypothetical protein IKI28_02850, partial [Bacteroidales bacterium]|nr:hypothetical protein [Bacteroidales bacterium]
ASQPRSLAASQPRSLAASQPRSLAASQPRSLAASQPRSLAASQPKSTPIYIGARHSHKYLISSMKHLKSAIATIASAGIRRMELEQPLPLGKRAGRGAEHGCGPCCKSFRAVALAEGRSPNERWHAAAF